MPRRGIRTQAKSQDVAVDPHDNASPYARSIPQRVAESLFASAQVAVQDWDFEDVGVISLGLAGLGPLGENLRRDAFQRPSHRDAVSAGADYERAIDAAVQTGKI